MRILIDECLPKQLKAWLAGHHEAITVRDVGWANTKNGKLLRLAEEAGFDVLATADKNLYHQQNFTGLRLSTIVIPSNRKRKVRESVPAFLQSLENARAGQKIVMEFDANNPAWESQRLQGMREEQDRTVHVLR
jgi:predicted nuclease of predicted toxin-antitoxin system